jgi:hypothetical protein
MITENHKKNLLLSAYAKSIKQELAFLREKESTLFLTENS